MPGVVIFAGLAGAAILGALGILSVQTIDLIYLAATIWAVAKLALMRFSSHGLVIGLTLAVGASLLAARLAFPDLRYAPYLVVLPGNMFIAYIFARGLLPGREPILVELIRLMDRHPIDNPRFIRFVRGQCLLWTAFSLATAILAFICIIWSTAHPGWVTTLGVLVLIQLAWLPISHMYAGARYGRPERLWHTIQALSRPEGRALIAL